MPASVESRSFTAGTFELAIDGVKQTAYLKSIEGGYHKGTLVNEPTGSTLERLKHLSGVVEIEPIQFEISLAAASPMFNWISKSWKREFARHSGQIVHATFNAKQRLLHEFKNALMVETTFPTLDGEAKDSGYVKCKVQPEEVSFDASSIALPESQGRTLNPQPMDQRHKTFSLRSFRLNIHGIEGIQANKIDSFTIKQGISKLSTGLARLPEIEPNKLEFPNITGTLSTHNAGNLLKWADDSLRLGRRDSNNQKTGSIEFLSPDGKETLFEIGLNEVGLLGCSPDGAEKAKSGAIKRMKFELFVGSMELKPGKGSGGNKNVA